MHARIELTWRSADQIAEMSEDKYAQLREVLPGLELPLPRPDGFKLGYDRREHTIDLSTTGERLVALGVIFEIKRFTSCYKPAGEGLAGSTTNIQIAIPNLLLFAVDEVQLLEDACTDSLQRELDAGWRILAVCPPPAQRRPDYILGRQKGVT